jgi:phospholipase A1
MDYVYCMEEQAMKNLLFAFLGMMLSLSVMAAKSVEVSDYQGCLLQRLDQASADLTIGALKRECLRAANVNSEQDVITAVAAEDDSSIHRRLAREREGVFNPFALTPHKPSYLLYSTMDEANQGPYSGLLGTSEPLDDTEMIFQVSFKAPVWREVFGTNGDLFVGYTARSDWQLFNDEISSPFRETNYEPEVFWQSETNRKILGWNLSGYRLGFVHQSNGRNVPLSRSWNRIYAHLGFDRGPWTLALKPWYRIPEDEKEFPGDTEGDDNPDMWKYMGYGEYSLIYRTRKQHVLSLMTRYNFYSDGRGAAQLSWSFPLNNRFRGFAEVFSGYGDSMIDYNESITRISLGIALTDNL